MYRPMQQQTAVLKIKTGRILNINVAEHKLRPCLLGIDDDDDNNCVLESVIQILTIQEKGCTGKQTYCPAV